MKCWIPPELHAVLNKTGVEMWILCGRKKKRFMQLLFCTKVSSHAQCKTLVVMQGLLYYKRHTCIQYCTKSAQLDVCLKNVHFNSELFIELTNICQYLSVEKWNMVLSHKICSSLNFAIVVFPLCCCGFTAQIKNGCMLIVWQRELILFKVKREKIFKMH